MKTADPAKRPPNDRGQGRKALAPELRTVTKSCRLTPEGWRQFAELGGNKWFAEAVRQAHQEKEKRNTKNT